MVRRVVVVAFDGCQSLDVVGPLEVFAGAREIQAKRNARDPGYEPIVVGFGQKQVRAESGLTLLPHASIAQVLARRGAIDTMVVAGGAGVHRAVTVPARVEAIRRLARRSKRVTSVCTGAFLLAAAGLLDGRHATTHWAACKRLAERHPQIEVERDPIYVKDGHVYTSAGVTAGIDLALALVEEDLGHEVALLLARWLVVFVRRAGGQSQFSAPLAAQSAERPALRDTQAYVVEHPGAPLDVPSLARRAAMSPRHFSRLFRSETGESPAAYVERVRVDMARRLLEATADSVENIAGACGFGTPDALRRAFQRRAGLGPREYRARFGETPGKGPS